MKLIYLIEDHYSIRESVEQYLKLSGFEVASFSLIKNLRKAIDQRVPDLIIQDVMLPDGDGFAFVKELKQTHDIPIIFMTARTMESDRIIGFELGADDYISKPFSPKELVLRVEALFRRIDKSSVQSLPQYKMNNGVKMDFDELTHTCHINDKEIFLTAAEWRVLALLIKSKGALVSRKEILEEGFNYQSASYERIVDTHIKNIRSKIDLEGSSWIETVRGYGYRFIDEGSSETEG